MSYRAELQAFLVETEGSEPESIMGQLRREALELFVLPEGSIEALAIAARQGVDAVRIAHFGLDYLPTQDEGDTEDEDEDDDEFTRQ